MCVYKLVTMWSLTANKETHNKHQLNYGYSLILHQLNYGYSLILHQFNYGYSLILHQFNYGYSLILPFRLSLFDRFCRRVGSAWVESNLYICIYCFTISAFPLEIELWREEGLWFVHLTGLTPTHCLACSKVVVRFPSANIVVFLVFNDKRWKLFFALLIGWFFLITLSKLSFHNQPVNNVDSPRLSYNPSLSREVKVLIKNLHRCCRIKSILICVLWRRIKYK